MNTYDDKTFSRRRAPASTNKFYRALAASLALLAPAARPARAATLNDLLNGASIDAGATRFRDWQLGSLNATAAAPNLAGIAVTPLLDDLTHPGLQLTSTGALTTTGVNSIDLVVKFRIDVLPGGKALTGQSLDLSGVSFDGFAGIATVSQETASLGGSDLGASVVLAVHGANFFQTQSAASFAPRRSVVATADVFVTGLAPRDSVSLNMFRIRVAQTGRLPIAGDFDGDGDVDAADLVQWQGDFGLNDDSDADLDGDSDGDDFLAWQRNLGATTLAIAAAAAVPEPLTAFLLLLAATAAGSFRRRATSR